MTEEDVGQSAGHTDPDNVRAVYNQLCESYRAIDVFRGTLLGALPLVSGGTFIFVGTNVIGTNVNPVLLLFIGAFGALVTLGLFIFEIYATNKCTELIKHGRELEEKYLRIKGQFATRPEGVKGFLAVPATGPTSGLVSAENQSVGWLRKRVENIAPFVNEPLASGIIYPAALGGWVFLGLHRAMDTQAGLIASGLCGVLVFVLGFWASFLFNRWLARNGPTQEEKLRSGLPGAGNHR
jgi:hypothetical protein